MSGGWANGARGPAGAAGATGATGASGPNVTIAAYASAPGSPTSGQLHMASDGVLRMYNGSRWCPVLHTMSGSMLGREPPVASGWTHIQQGGSTLTDANGALIYAYASGAATAYRSIVRTMQGTASIAYVDGMVNVLSRQAGSATSRYPGGGIVMRESGTNKCARMMLAVNASSSAPTWYIETEYGTDTADTNGQEHTYQCNGPLFMRLVRSSTNILWRISTNPAQCGWTTIRTVATTTAFTTAPDQVGITSQSFYDDAGNTLIIPHWEQGDTTNGASAAQ